MTSVPLFLVIFLLPLTILTGYQLGGAFTFGTLVWVFVAIPIWDHLLGTETKNPRPEDEKALNENKAYRYVTYAVAPVQLFLVVWGAYVVTRGTLTPLEIVGLTLSIGVTTGTMGINLSHELVHKHTKIESILGYFTLSLVFYSHWGMEHVKGHHRWVATPDDPATARQGQSFYRFLPQTILGGLASSWRIEKRLRTHRGLPVWSPNNKVIRGLIAQIAIAAVLAIAFGPWAIAFYLVQSFAAVCMLEVINYVEHYGLLRAKKENGDYEPVRPIHSWNSSQWLTNYFLFNLERHSDHHYKPARRYQILRHFDDAPQLPTGYAGMLLMALVPPLWFRVMDPILRRHREQTGMPSRV